MTRKTIVATVLVAAAVGATLTGVGSAKEAGVSFACGNPKIEPLGKIYGASRGTIFCNDGARATVLIAGKPRLTLVGGVCWRNRENLEVGIGTLVINGRKKSDPAGLLLTDEKPGDPIGDTLDLSRGTYHWTDSVKVNLTGKTKGTFAGKSPMLVGGKLTSVSLRGSFTCKRILDAPDQ